MIWCLHGTLGQAGDWDAFSQALAKKGKICRGVELWRFLECEGLSLVDWAAAFNAEVKAAGEEENVMVAYSMGGRLGLHALLESPELWNRAVIVSAHPGLKEESARLERMASDAAWAGQALTSDWQQFLQKWDAQPVLGERAEQKSDPRIKLVNRRRAIARSFMEWSLGKQENTAVRFGELTCPLLWVTGERDEKFTALAAETVSDLPKGRHEVLPAGHRVPWEKPEEFVNLVDSFLLEE